MKVKVKYLFETEKSNNEIISVLLTPKRRQQLIMMKISDQDLAPEYQNIYQKQTGSKVKHNFNNRSKRWRCQDCENCHKLDCGKCENCLDKTKFGGMNKKRQKCVERLCLNMRDTIKHPSVKNEDNKIFDAKMKKPIPKPKDEVFEIGIASNNIAQNDIVSKLKALFDDPDDEAYWKEFCEVDEIKVVATEVENYEKPISSKYHPCSQCNATYSKRTSLYHHVYMKHKRKNTI